jgi:hypothetical protein
MGKRYIRETRVCTKLVENLEQKIDSGLGGRIVLKWIVEKWVVKM